MNKKLIAISIVVVFLLVAFFPTVSSNKSNDDSQNLSFFGLGSDIDLEYDEEDVKDPIKPLVKTEVTLNIKYKIVSSGRLLSKLIFRLHEGKEVDIKLEIAYKPDLCVVTLNPETLSATVSDEELNLSSVLSIEFNEDAPAYYDDHVKINVSTGDIKGLFGLTRITGFEEQYEIPIKPGYLPIIDIEYPLGDEIEISPYNETKIPINITNLGNGRTKVIAEVENCSENWNVSISDVTIDVGETEQASLVVIADHKFDVESVKFKFTPAFAENLLDTGPTEHCILSFINDGSYKEEEGLEIDSTILIIIIVVIILILVFAIILKRKR